MLDVRRLRLLRDLAHLGTIAAVAEAHAYTPSAVSQQLAALQREAGVALLTRTGRRVSLTPAGATLVQHTETVLAALEAGVGLIPLPIRRRTRVAYRRGGGGHPAVAACVAAIQASTDAYLGAMSSRATPASTGNPTAKLRCR